MNNDEINYKYYKIVLLFLTNEYKISFINKDKML